jgi:hypothetical protein
MCVLPSETASAQGSNHLSKKHQDAATGASALLRPSQPPAVTSFAGGDLALATQVTAVGFNPLDLFYASLASCIVLSVRIAA